MINQILIRVLGYTFTFIALPALAIIGISYYRKYKSKGSVLFAIGSIATAIGSEAVKGDGLTVLFICITALLNDLSKQMSIINHIHCMQ